MKRAPDDPRDDRGGGADPPTALVGVEWGPRRARAMRLTAAGQILAEAHEPDWPARARLVGFGPICDGLREALGVAPHVPALLSGAVGAPGGWLDAGFVDCPAGPDDIAAALAPVPGEAATRVVPGLRVDTAEAADLMRGGGAALAGLLESAPGARDGIRDGIACLPGHHTRWVRMARGRIQTFTTHVTGELRSLCLRHGIAADAPRDPAPDPRAFAAGVRASATPGGLTAHLFGARALPATGRLPPEAVAPWLSGLLIGHECRAVLARWPDVSAVMLVGARARTGPHAEALRLLKVVSAEIDGDAALGRGLARIAIRGGLITPR